MLKKDIIPESSSQKQRASEFCKIAKTLLQFSDDKRKDNSTIKQFDNDVFITKDNFIKQKNELLKKRKFWKKSKI